MSTLPHPLTIGLSAKLGSPRSPHLDAFERAVSRARQLYPDLHGRYRFVYADDKATPSGGASAANSLIEQGVDVVVGHFASGAARAALNRYAGSDIAVFLPAATDSGLTQLHEPVYRTCNSDIAMANAIADFFNDRNIDDTALHNDGSSHGCALMGCIGDVFADRGLNSVDATDSQNQLFVGMYEGSVEFANKLRTAGYTGSVYFTDDAQHASLGADLISAPGTFVFGYPPSDWCSASKSACTDYRNQWSSDPGIYYLETLASLQLVFQCLQNSTAASRFTSNLVGNQWPTCLGELNTIGPELGRGKFAIWHPDENKVLTPVSLQSASIAQRKTEEA